MEKNRKQWGTMSIYDTLNDRQREAVFKTKGPVLILAGAGSGKGGKYAGGRADM